MPPTAPKFKGAVPGRHIGRIPSTQEQRRKALPLGAYVKRYGAPPPPASVDWGTKATKSKGQMFGNDTHGDCVIADQFNGIAIHSANAPGGSEQVGSAAEALKEYARICGPGDRGCYMPAVLDYATEKGLRCGGATHGLDGYCLIDNRDVLLTKVALAEFGGLSVGVNLPRAWYTDADDGFVWDKAPLDIVGGHAIRAYGYDDEGVKVITWGARGKITWNAWADARYVEEVYLPLGKDWYNAEGASAGGIDVEKLKADLEIVKGGGTPDPFPPSPPTPPTPPEPTPSGWSGKGKLHTPMGDWDMDMTGTVASADLNAPNTAPNFLQVLALLAQLWSDARKRDWVAVARDLEELLKLLGMQGREEALTKLAAALGHRVETAVLDYPSPPSDHSDVDEDEDKG